MGTFELEPLEGKEVNPPIGYLLACQEESRMDTTALVRDISAAPLNVDPIHQISVMPLGGDLVHLKIARNARPRIFITNPETGRILRGNGKCIGTA